MASFRERLGLREPVGDSADLDRILDLPRRPRLVPNSPRARALVHLMTERLRLERTTPCACASLGRPCIEELLETQAWALWEISVYEVVFGAIGVGHGKTLLDILAPMVLPGCKVAVLLVPPGLRAQLWADYLALSEHFRVPSIIFDDGRGKIIPGAPTIHVLPFSRLSRPESTDLLESIRPDAFLTDEAHRLKDLTAVGTGRIARYMAKYPDTRFLPWSGTMTTRGPRDCAHLIAWALGFGAPMPLDSRVVEEWDLALGAHDWPAPPGRLRRLCRRDEEVRVAFHERLVETPGVIATREGAIGASINLRDRKVTTPANVASVLDQMRTDWERPDGEEFVEILEVHACARQLAGGFYYRWKFPRGEPRELIEEWFAARKFWNRELRDKLVGRTAHLDSPHLCTEAARRYHENVGAFVCEAPHCGHRASQREPHTRLDETTVAIPCHGRMRELPTWAADAWPRWDRVRSLVYHDVEAVWVDDFLAQDAAEWARKNRGIVWYEHVAFGLKVASLLGVEVHGGGPGAGERISRISGKTSIVASIDAHGTGRDGLQRHFATNLVTSPPGNGDGWEQLLGRTHRIGQKADEVDAWVYRHEPELRAAVDGAVLQAKYVRDIVGGSQKLLIATPDFELER